MAAIPLRCCALAKEELIVWLGETHFDPDQMFGFPQQTVALGHKRGRHTIKQRPTNVGYGDMGPSTATAHRLYKREAMDSQNYFPECGIST
jgi:hypothetical protein